MVLDQTRERGRERERERENKKNWKQQRACKTQICLSEQILKPILIHEIIFWTFVRISQKRNNIIRDFLPKLEGLFSVGKYMNNAQKTGNKRQQKHYNKIQSAECLWLVDCVNSSFFI